MTQYYSNDFDFNEWKIFVLENYSLPEITPLICNNNHINDINNNISHNSNINNSNGNPADNQWDNFYSNHASGQVYKPRNYLCVEFSRFLSDSNVKCVVDVGCGHGCSMIPIVNNFSIPCYIATDYSNQALAILTHDNNFINNNNCHVLQWDITQPPPTPLLSLIDSEINSYSSSSKVDIVIVSVFTLSAVHPDYHVTCLKNMRNILMKHRNNNNDNSSNTNSTNNNDQSRSAILFRDYGVYDMTMFRHRKRYDCNLFERNDGTLAYYFDLDYVRSIAIEANLNITELEYATVINKNRKTKQEMRRIFVHAVFELNG